MDNIVSIIAHKDYNHFLSDAISACLSQTIPNTVCVIDDGSITPPLNEIKSLVGNPIEIKDNVYIFNGVVLIINGKSEGPSKARNIGIEYFYDWADYFNIVDADDIPRPEKIGKMMEYLSDPNIGVVYADYIINDVEYNSNKMEFKSHFDESYLRKNCIVHSGSMISKKALESVKRGKNEWYLNKLRTCEDYNLWLRISKKYIIYHVPEFLTLVREHSNNSTKTVNSQIWQQNMLEAVQDI